MPVTAKAVATGVKILKPVAKAVIAGVRARRARKQIEELEKNLKEPRYELPQELMSTYNMQLGQRTDMPGQQLAQYGLDYSYGVGLGGASRAATSSQDLLSSATQLGQQRMIGGLGLASQAADYQRKAEQQKMQNLADLSTQIAGYRYSQYEQNQLNPFLRTSAAISALREKRYQQINNMTEGIYNALDQVSGEMTTAQQAQNSGYQGNMSGNGGGGLNANSLGGTTGGSTAPGAGGFDMNQVIAGGEMLVG